MGRTHVRAYSRTPHAGPRRPGVASCGGARVALRFDRAAAAPRLGAREGELAKLVPHHLRRHLDLLLLLPIVHEEGAAEVLHLDFSPPRHRLPSAGVHVGGCGQTSRPRPASTQGGKRTSGGLAPTPGCVDAGGDAVERRRISRAHGAAIP
eukprot:scaffold65088_cov52-Phaeocystis_antarctica.AAC.2